MGGLGKINASKEQMLGLLRANKGFWGCVFLSLGMLLSGLLVLLPSVSGQLAVDRENVDRVQGQLRAVELYQEEYADYRAHEDALAKELEYRHRLLPKELTIAVIMGELQQKAVGTEVELTGIKPLGKAGGSSVAISLSVKGTYYSCLDFIHAITTSGQLIKVDNIQVNADPKRGGITCKLDIRAYGDTAIGEIIA